MATYLLDPGGRVVTRCVRGSAIRPSIPDLAALRPGSCADPGRDGHATLDGLWPARLFVANGAITAIRRYVEEVLAPLLDSTDSSTKMLETLRYFFDTGRGVRESAAQLGVHQDTVRLRLAKAHSLTGLDVAADAHDQLTVQTALLVLRLQGHRAITRS
jgi:DNA-binding PucR family transcriptional regulator